MMDTLHQDLRFALRALRRQPGFTAVAVLTLALGLGANTALFSVLRAALLRPLPFTDGDRLVRVYQVPDDGTLRISLSPESFRQVREQQASFSGMVAQRYTDTTLLSQEGPRRLVGMAVSERWTEVLGVEPTLGRSFTPEEEQAGEDAGVALIGHGLWQRRFGGDPGALGESLHLNGRLHTVVGVLPPGFKYPYDAEVWFPISLDAPGTWGLNVQARLAPGLTLEQARADLATVSARLAQEQPDAYRGYTLTPIPTREVLVGDQGRSLVLLFATVGFVLLIVCANLANLLLARAVSRAREMRVRAALGASRLRRLRQSLTESLVLALLGGAAGLIFALWGVEALAPLIPGRMGNVLEQVPMDTPVLLFAFGAALATGLLFGLAPALEGSRANLVSGLGRRGGGAGRGRLLEALVVLEIAFALIPLAGAGLAIDNLARLHGVELGYDPQGLKVFSVPLDQGELIRPEERRLFLRQAEESLAALPGVEAAGATSIFPSPRGNTLSRVEVEGQPTDPGERLLANFRLVTPDFLRALELPLIRGRMLDGRDGPESRPVAVVSESMARRYWPGEDPVGQRVRSLRSEGASPWLTVVGVVGDVREFDDVADTWYLPVAQNADSTLAGRATFAVRSAAGRPAAGELQQAIWQVAPALPVYDLMPAGEMYFGTLSGDRFGTALLGLLAAFGLLLAGLGVYGVLAYAVNRRSHEIGVRMALGAGPAAVLRWILVRGARLAVLGLALGLAGAAALARLMAGLLTEVEGQDPRTLVVATLLLAATALAACYLPARRAARQDPSAVLRRE